ncbi:MAG: type II CAAX endopeptidase family protein [Vulcanimicrobiota bacterium]
MNPLTRFLAAAAAVWVGSWLPLGLWVGDWDYALTPASRDTLGRQIYQILFYGGLLAVFGWSWRKDPPARPGWGSVRLFLFFFIQGLLATAVFRWILYSLGYAQWQLSEQTLLFWAQVLLSCLVVGLVEEAVFRGFLLGHLVAGLGWRRGVWLTSLIFALVHLFRPGPLQFKVCYGVGLLLLGYLLARLAWHHNAVGASAGFHAGIILFNIATTLTAFEANVLAGWNHEPVSGLLSWLLTLGFLVLWQQTMSRKL